MILIWYPKCSTCKKSKKFLEDKKLSFKCRDIVLDNPNPLELKEYIMKSGLDIGKFFNTSGLKYRELGLKDKLKNLSFDDKINLLSSDGMLIKRPLLILKDKVLVGFKEKEWSEVDENS